MKVGIVGWGIEGQSAMRHFGPDHEYLIVNEEPRDDFPAQTDKIKVQHLTTNKPPGLTGNAPDLSYLAGITDCDKIVYSVTSYHNLEKTFGDNMAFWHKATSVMQLFFESSPTKQIIGVTGTKGKGTTSTLLYLMLKEAGKTVYLSGNIGTSVLDLLPDLKSDDWVVIEMSNFQLNHFPYSPHIAICLKITPEHLDWHPDLDDYLAAKANIFSHQTDDDIAVYFADNKYSQQLVGNSPGHKIPYYSPPGACLKEGHTVVVGENSSEVISKSDIKLMGDYNLENVCAALTAFWQISQDKAAAHKVLSGFSGLPHRLEFVRELDGVKYYDDSFGTNPDTARVAIQALVQPVILIVGGYDRGISPEPLIEAILRDRVRHVVTIGQTGPKIAELLADKDYKEVTPVKGGMDEIVAAAKAQAEHGDAILLSPAAASFDMFKNFEVRGREFQKAVKAL